MNLHQPKLLALSSSIEQHLLNELAKDHFDLKIIDRQSDEVILSEVASMRPEMVLVEEDFLNSALYQKMRYEIPSIPILSLSNSVEKIRQFYMEFHVDAYEESEVEQEYDRFSGASEEYRKLNWGSDRGMQRAFEIADMLVDWSGVKTWCDLGVGTGAFLNYVSNRHAIQRFVGIDLSSKLLEVASARSYGAIKAEFIKRSLREPVGERFDLVTSIGVLQKCGLPLVKAIAKLSEMMNPGGTLFLTTKNAGWEKFQNAAGLKPYSGHHWFHVEEIKSALDAAGLQIRELAGFEPKTEEIGRPEFFHSIYVCAERKTRARD